MKRFVLFLSAIIITLSSIAQERMTFRGITIGGNKEEFVQKMQDLGYIIDEDRTSKDQMIMRGSFAGYDDCMIAIGFSKISLTPYSVMVYLPEADYFSKVEGQYYQLKKAFVNKYGEPGDCWEYFRSPYKNGDGKEFKAISELYACFECYWSKENGTIYIGIKSLFSDKSGMVAMAYQDRESSEIMKKEREKVLKDI